jgi:hypothetical protein
MSQGLRKLSAFFMVILTAVGIILSIFFLVQIWRYRQPVTSRLQTGIDQGSTVLQITDDGLVVIDQVVKNVYTSTTYLDQATNALSQTVSATGRFMDSAGVFVGNNLITTITNTQAALGSAEASAKVIDTVLSTMSRLPLVGFTYNPVVPLNKALGDVSDSLDPLQLTLKNFQTNLENTRNNMQEFTGQMAVLDKNILSIQRNLVQAQTTIHKYRQQINMLTTWLSDARVNLPRWMTAAAWILTLVFVWLMIVQLSIMLQAFTMLFTPRPAQVPLEKPVN